MQLPTTARMDAPVPWLPRARDIGGHARPAPRRPGLRLGRLILHRLPTLLAPSALAWFLASVPAGATPPDYEFAWVDTGALERAAEVFSEPERESFRRALERVTTGGTCDRMGPKEDRFRCVGPLGRVQVPLADLICPAVMAGKVPTVEAFLARVSKRRLVQGVQSRRGLTTVWFGLSRVRGNWVLLGRHRPVSYPPGTEGFGEVVFLRC